MSEAIEVKPRPSVFWAVTGAGLAWSLFGMVQFLTSLAATPETLRASGMTPEQATVMLGYPVWMTAAFAVGVFGGVIGCALMALKRSAAVPVLAASLVGYVILYIGDIIEGVFAALGPPQVIVLSAVVVIAAALWWYARRLAAQGTLR